MTTARTRDRSRRTGRERHHRGPASTALSFVEAAERAVTDAERAETRERALRSLAIVRRMLDNLHAEVWAITERVGEGSRETR
jgi:hypothetical protein